LREQDQSEDGRRLPQAWGSTATFYKWKARYGGLDTSDAERLKALEDENTKLKKLLAEAMLDNAMFKEITTKNGARPPRHARGCRAPMFRVRDERAGELTSMVILCWSQEHRVEWDFCRGVLWGLRDELLGRLWRSKRTNPV
jgi:putative transposase